MGCQRGLQACSDCTEPAAAGVLDVECDGTLVSGKRGLNALTPKSRGRGSQTTEIANLKLPTLAHERASYGRGCQSGDAASSMPVLRTGPALFEPTPDLAGCATMRNLAGRRACQRSRSWRGCCT